jgi:hypothetical protein
MKEKAADTFSAVAEERHGLVVGNLTPHLKKSSEHFAHARKCRRFLRQERHFPTTAPKGWTNGGTTFVSTT